LGQPWVDLKQEHPEWARLHYDRPHCEQTDGQIVAQASYRATNVPVVPVESRLTLRPQRVAYPMANRKDNCQ